MRNTDIHKRDMSKASWMNHIFLFFSRLALGGTLYPVPAVRGYLSLGFELNPVWLWVLEELIGGKTL